MTLALWTLKDIMELADSKTLSIVLADLQNFLSDCTERKRKIAIVREHKLVSAEVAIEYGPNPTYRDQILGTLKLARDLCRNAKWESAGNTIGLIIIHLDNHQDEWDWSSISSDLRTSLHCVITAMWKAQFVMVNPLYCGYVNNSSLLGEQVEKAFPSASDDLKEAGNCITTDSGTAAVFHLMRAVEWGIRALCVDLGVLAIPRKKATIPIEFSEWDKILNQLNPAAEAKIDAMSPGPLKQETQEFYFPLLFDVRGFKDAFRNHVMHTRQTYSQKAADDVLDYVRRFFTLLSTKIAE